MGRDHPEGSFRLENNGSAAADVADLQAFVDALYGRRKPRGVVDALLEERRREAAEEE